MDGCGRQLVSSAHTYTLTAWTHLAIHRLGFTASTHFPASAVYWWPSCLSIEWELFCVHCAKVLQRGGSLGVLLFLSFTFGLLSEYVFACAPSPTLYIRSFLVHTHVFYIDI